MIRDPERRAAIVAHPREAEAALHGAALLADNNGDPEARKAIRSLEWGVHTEIVNQWYEPEPTT